MKCCKCGTELTEGAFCPTCGAKNKVGKGVKKRKKKRGFVIIIAIIAIICGIFVFSGNASSSIPDGLILSVQNGYLGHYDTVTIQEVLESVYQDGEWNAGEAKSGDYYIVEYSSKNAIIQFSIDSLDAEKFNVSGVRADEVDEDSAEAYDVKVYMDNVYFLYSETHPEKELNIDESISNNTLEGHVGPIKSVEESEYAKPHSDASAKQDLYFYSSYTEKELVTELGYEINEFGCYPDESHVNFMFMDGNMYSIMLSTMHDEDLAESLCGVFLNDSLEKASEVLECNGFVCIGSYNTATGSVTAYEENESGYSFTVEADASNTVTMLVYGLQKEDEISVIEESSVEESISNNSRTLVYGTYAYDNGINAICSAEVGFYTDEYGGDYIYVDCWGYGGHELIFFEGMLTEKEDGSYYAYCEGFEASITVTFVDGGLHIAVCDSNDSEMYAIEGFYTLESSIDFNEVG